MNRLRQGSHLVGSQHVGGRVYGGSVAVGGADKHLQLCAVIPDGSILIGILPFDADGACNRVGPLGRVVFYAQQVEHVERTRRCGRCGIVAQSPQLLG